MRLAQFFFGWLKLHHAVRVCDTSGNRSNSYTSSSCVAPDWSSRYSEPHKNQSPSFTVVVLTWALVFILAPFVSHRYGFMYVETDEYSYKSELYGSVSSNSYWTVAASESFITDANCMKCPVDAPGIEVERASSLGNHGRTRGRHALPTSEMPSILQISGWILAPTISTDSVPLSAWTATQGICSQREEMSYISQATNNFHIRMRTF